MVAIEYDGQCEGWWKQKIYWPLEVGTLPSVSLI